MHLENRGHEHMLGQRVAWYRIRQDAADKLRVGDGTGRFDAIERKPRALRHRHIAGQCQQLMPRLIEGVVAPERGTVERRRAELPGADDRIGGGHLPFGQTVLESMLNVGQIGEKDEIGSQRIAVGE